MNTDLPLPRRIWWPWNDPVVRVGFTTVFNLKSQEEARLALSTSGSYKAWLDGTALAVPDSNLPSWRAMHHYVLYLPTGEHRLCVQVEQGGQEQPFFLACLEWKQDGVPVRLATDSGWKMLANPPEGWTEMVGSLPLRPAWAFDGVWAEPWGMPCNAPEDFCRLGTGWQAITSEKLNAAASLYAGLQSSGLLVRQRSNGSLEFTPPLPYPPSPPRLEQARPRLEWYRSREHHSQINNNWLDLFEVRCPHAVLDTGGETFARLKVQVVSGGPAILALTTGESLNEVHRYARRVTDIFELKDGECFTTAPTGFRYAKVMALSCYGKSVVLEPVEVQHIRYPVAMEGLFTCSDPLLNHIFNLSRQTAHLCMQNEIWDGIKRDQLPWMGDLYTEALAVYHLFGDARLARRSLEVLAELGPAPARPLAQQFYPGLLAIWKNVQGDINGIPAYTLWWLLGLADYLRYTGDSSLAGELLPEIQAALLHIQSWVGEDGMWRLRDGWDFIDWSPVSAAERQVYCHLLACRALNAGMLLLDSAGASIKDVSELHQRMLAAARGAWLQDGKGIFGSSHHANAMAIQSQALTVDESRCLFLRTLADDPPLRMTYWHRFLDLTAAASVGEVTWGLNYIRRHWGQAQQVGMTALWEAFDPEWLCDDPHAVTMVGAEYARYGGYETSLCHGWSAGPAVWLHTTVLGVEPAVPGWQRVRFAPDLGDLAWAKGSVPTPLGKITVMLERTGDGSLQCEISLPQGMQIEIPQDNPAHRGRMEIKRY